MVNPLINPVLTGDKQARKEKYADLAVQGTNNSSIASKRSVESIYLSQFDDINRHKDSNDLIEYFKFFVPKVINRSPCINRGYWLRLHAIRSRLDSIVSYRDEHYPKKQIVVINLGCGFDPLPFQMLDKNNKSSAKYNQNCSFLDIDYSDLLMKKIEIIANNEELSTIVGSNNDSQNMTKDRYTSSNYFIRPCDLNDTDAFEKLLLQSQNDLPFLYDDENVIKVFIAEVSLAYMKAELSDKIIEITSNLKDSHFIMLEQLIPEGLYEPFSKQMLKHFKKNDSPLQSVINYHTIQSQIDRFTKLGYSNCNAGDMLQLWNNLSLEIKQKIETIQPFDELEEFHLFCHHYIISHCTNNSEFTFVEPYNFHKTNHLTKVEDLKEISIQTKISINDTQIKRTFGSSISMGPTKLIYFGGCTPYRVNELLMIDTKKNEILKSQSKDRPLARTCHALIKSEENAILLVGGRNAPHKPYKDVWSYDLSNETWKQCANLPQTRFRHCITSYDSENIIIYGGKTPDTSKDPAILKYNYIEDKFDTITVDVPMKSLVSSAMDYQHSTNRLVIAGGYDSTTYNISDKFSIFKFDGPDKLVQVNEFTNPLFQRYGSKTKFINETQIILIGGTSSGGLFNDKTSIIIVDITTGDIESVPIPEKIWQDESLMFVGFELEWDNETKQLTIIGGGATCYGFGMVTNSTLVLQL